jgi:periplasmic copper chaperone A
MSWFRRARDPLPDTPGGDASRSFARDGLEVGSPWARAALRATGNGGGYFTLANKGTVPDRLTGASSPAAERVELHGIKVEGSGLRMRPLANGLALSPGTAFTLKPRGYHLLLVGLKAPLQEGTPLAVTLAFEKAGSLDIELVVAAPGPVGGEAL